MRRTHVATAALLALVMCVSAAYGFVGYRRNPNTGTVKAQVLIKGVGPMLNGTVFFIDEAVGIPPSPTKYWMVPTHAFALDENSRFSVELPEGTYYIGAIEKASGETLGPPEEGDYFFVGQDSKGNAKKLTVWRGATIDLGDLDQAVKFRKSSLETKGITMIEGLLRDPHGTPVGGLFVSAYATPDLMTRPLYVSARTGLDGKYFLRLPKGGSYYLLARSNYGGGPPPADELIGERKDGKPITVKTGMVKKGIDITVWPLSMLE